MDSSSPHASLSVVMCTYNGAPFIREQMDSLLNQTYPVSEILVQDDCSTDGTFDILCAYAAQYPRIHVQRNGQQLGVNRNFFSAMARAKGDFIAISDQDDIWEPDKLELQMAAIGSKLLCAGRSTPFSHHGAPIREEKAVPNYSLLRMLYVGSLPGHTLLFARRLLEILPDISGIAAIRYYDVILTMTAASYGSIAYVDRTLVHQRKHVGSGAYSVPTDNRMTLHNIVRNLTNPFRYYLELRPVIRERAAIAYGFLAQIHSSEPALQEALFLLKAQTKRSPWWLVRLSLFCYRHRRELTNSIQGSNGLKSRIKALYFPIYCSTYLRYMSKRFK